MPNLLITPQLISRLSFLLCDRLLAHSPLGGASIWPPVFGNSATNVLCIPVQPWTSVEEIKAAVSRVQAATDAESLPSDLDAIRLKPVRQELLATPQTTVKIHSQEKQAGEKIGLAITYGQIKLVLADLRQQLGLEAAATIPPPPIDELKDPGVGLQEPGF